MMGRKHFGMRTTRSRFVRSVQFARPVSRLMIEGFLVALGISSSVVVRLVGDLFVAEIAMIVTFPFVLAFSIRRLQRPYLIRLFVLLGLWFLAQVLSDAYNHTVWLDRMRGMAGIIVFTTEIAFLAMVVAENERRKTIFITAFAIGSVVLTRYQPNVAAIGLEGADAWKWSYSFGVTILALLASSLLAARGRQVFALLLLIGVSAIDLLMNSRSAFLMLLVSTVLAFPIIPDQIGRFGLLPQRNNLFRVAMVVVLALAAGWSANQLLRLVTRSGLISEEAQEKNESEAQAGNLLLGGRPEVFIGLHAVMDSPVLGHGSWARDMKYTEMQYDLMQEYGINGDLTDTEADTRGLIPSHSHIIGAWVYAGLFGAIFWGYVIWLLTNAIVIVAVRRPPMAPVYSWLLVGFFWNILFSPFGSTSRIFEAFILIAIVDLLKLRVPADRTLRGKASWHRVPITRPSLAGGHVG